MIDTKPPCLIFKKGYINSAIGLSLISGAEWIPPDWRPSELRSTHRLRELVLMNRHKKSHPEKNGLQNCGAEWIRSDWRSSHRLRELVLMNRHKKSHPKKNGLQNCGAEWIRTTDSRIFSPMLYQLSYSTKFWVGKSRYFFEKAKFNLKFVAGNF